MSNTYTANIKVAQPGSGDRTWNIALNANATILDALAPIGALAVTTVEVPSASLNVQVAAGNYLQQDGTIATYGGTASQAIATVSTKVLFLDLTAAGALTVAGAFPTTAHIRLATVVAGATTITSIADGRVAFTVVGSYADGVNITLGTITGTKIGTATTQKLGFWNATPIIQPIGTTDLRTAMINLGLLATGGATPLNLNGGPLTVGSATIAETGNIALGTTTGTKIGTATTQKLGFFNATPIVQPTMGAATAGATYAATEQAMLQAVYNAVRNLGLGS